MKNNRCYISYAYVPSGDEKPIHSEVSGRANLAALPTGKSTIDALDSFLVLGESLSPDQRKDNGYDTGKQNIKNIINIMYKEI